MPKPTVLAQRITQARLKRGLSKSALAKMAGVTPAAVGAWEEGRAAPRPPMMMILSKVLGLDGAPAGGMKSATPAPAPVKSTGSGGAQQILAEARSQLAALWQVDAAEIVVTASVSAR